MDYSQSSILSEPRESFYTNSSRRAVNKSHYPPKCNIPIILCIIKYIFLFFYVSSRAVFKKKYARDVVQRGPVSKVGIELTAQGAPDVLGYRHSLRLFSCTPLNT